MTLGNMRANGVGTRSTDHMLTLKRASKHRAGGPWSNDDYDVFEGDQHIGALLQSKTAALDDRLSKPYGVLATGRICLSRCHPNRV
jgi:hypothetical protein